MTDEKHKKNLAFIDGQNLHMGTAKREDDPWHIDLTRFRIYLEQKYKVNKAYYFLGFVQNENHELYEEIQNAGFVLLFREHNPAMVGKKKGNVDSDIIFNIMKKLYKREDFSKVVLVYPKQNSSKKRKGLLRQLAFWIPFRLNTYILTNRI